MRNLPPFTDRTLQQSTARISVVHNRGCTCDPGGERAAETMQSVHHGGERTVPARIGYLAVPNAWTLFMKGQNVLSTNQDDIVSIAWSSDMELLERRARSLMILGHELEAITVNQQIVDRYTNLAEALLHTDWAHFNMGCAYARINKFEQAIDQFEIIVKHRIDTAGHRRLRLLATEGIHLAEEMMAQAHVGRKRRRQNFTPHLTD